MFSGCWCALALSVVTIPQALANRTMDFLEQFQLDDLKYVGLWQDTGQFRARNVGCLQDRAGRRHPVRRGNYVGRHFGVASAVSPAYLELRELRQSENGEWFEKVVVLPAERPGSPRSRANYEEDEMLRGLDVYGNPGSRVRQQLTLCRDIYRFDGKARLPCYDRVVGSW
jgi:hypothetical protein